MVFIYSDDCSRKGGKCGGSSDGSGCLEVMVSCR